MTRANVLAVVLVGLLVACPRPPVIEYAISAVIPLSVSPNQQVTVFGVLPAALQVKVDELEVNATPVNDGVQFTLPSQTIAGQRTIRLTSQSLTEPLEALLNVVPRLDNAVLEGSLLRVSGLGWATSGALDAEVRVNGRTLSATRVGAELQTNLPSPFPFGAVDVQVAVSGATSNTLRLAREAGAVRGRVQMAAAAGIAQSRAALPRASRSKVLTVFGSSAGVDLVGLQKRQVLRGLGAEQLTFSSLADAQSAYTLLERRGLKLEWASWMASTNTTAAFSSPPSAPGAGQWHLNAMGLPAVWTTNKGAGVTVAIVDTGVELTHPDMAGVLLPGYDFVDNDAQANDIAGHGSHVAGLVAANGQALGVAPHSKILPIRVLRDLSGGSDGPVAQGILWAANALEGQPNPNPAQVINLSLGSNTFSSLIASAVGTALAKGIVVIAASGNNGSSELAFPAALPGVVAVTALAGPINSYQPVYAQKGLGLWLSAFGGDMSADQDNNGVSDGILSLEVGGGYALRNGTSMAAPMVAGVATLALSSGVPTFLVRDALANTAIDLGVRGFDARFGYGMVNPSVGQLYTPKAYALLVSDNKVVAWTLVTANAEFVIGNLEPNKNYQLLVATDNDNDGVLAESGELISSLQALTTQSAQTLDAGTLTLNPSTGTQTYTLEARR
jgi:serine protease